MYLLCVRCREGWLRWGGGTRAESLLNVRHIARCAPRASRASPPAGLGGVCPSVPPGTCTGGGARAGKEAGGKVARAGLSPSDLVSREGFKQERDWTDVCIREVDEAEGIPGRGTSWSRGYANPRQVWDSGQLATGIKEEAGESGGGERYRPIGRALNAMLRCWDRCWG